MRQLSLFHCLPVACLDVVAKDIQTKMAGHDAVVREGAFAITDAKRLGTATAFLFQLLNAKIRIFFQEKTELLDNHILNAQSLHQNPRFLISGDLDKKRTFSNIYLFKIKINPERTALMRKEPESYSQLFQSIFLLLG